MHWGISVLVNGRGGERWGKLDCMNCCMLSDWYSEVCILWWSSLEDTDRKLLPHDAIFDGIEVPAISIIPE
jgi:hypothetical protein